MALLNYGLTAELELSAKAPSLETWTPEEHRAAAQAAAVEPADERSLLRGMMIATIPALLMWAAIFELAARLL